METVKAAKSFIEAELTKYGTWEEWTSYAGVGCSTIFESQRAWETTKGKGVGIETIHAFLGGQWKRHYIQGTLKVIKEEEDAARKKAEAYEAAQRAKERPGREIANEIERRFEVKVNPRTLISRVTRANAQADSNESPSENPAPAPVQGGNAGNKLSPQEVGPILSSRNGSNFGPVEHVGIVGERKIRSSSPGAILGNIEPPSQYTFPNIASTSFSASAFRQGRFFRGRG